MSVDPNELAVGASEAPPSSDRCEREAIVQKYLQAYNRFDIDGMVGCLTEDVVFENYSDGRLTIATHGVDEFRSLAESSRHLFSSRKQEILAIYAFDENALHAQVSFSAVMAVDVDNGPRKGEVVQVRGRAEYAFHGDLICRVIDVA